MYLWSSGLGVISHIYRDTERAAENDRILTFFLPVWCHDYAHVHIRFCPFDNAILEKVTVEWLLRELHSLEEELCRM